jgi:hypothetical protein
VFRLLISTNTIVSSIGFASDGSADESLQGDQTMILEEIIVHAIDKKEGQNIMPLPAAVQGSIFKFSHESFEILGFGIKLCLQIECCSGIVDKHAAHPCVLMDVIFMRAFWISMQASGIGH